MNLAISFKNLEHTPALDEKIKKKSEKFKKYIQGKVDVHWVCWIEDNQHFAEAIVRGGHKDFFAKASSDNMYKSFDKVVEKIEKQLLKQKELHNRMHWHGKILDIA